MTREMRQMQTELGSANGRVSRLEATVQQQGEMLAALLAGKNEQEKAATKDIEAHVREEVAAQCEPAARRRAQGDAALSDSGVVRIFKRDVSLSHLSSNVDRLLSEGGNPADCSSAEINRQMAATNVECCDGPNEDCSGGRVQSCNAGCGAMILPLWAACQAELGKAAKVLRDAVALCPPTASGGSEATHHFLAMIVSTRRAAERQRSVLHPDLQ